MLRTLLEGLKAFVVQPQDSSVPEERRDPVRARCHLPVTVTDGSEARHAVVCDISLQGLRLKLDVASPHSRLEVSHPPQDSEFELDTVRCDVLWTRKRKFSRDVVAGLKFIDHPSILERSWVNFALRSLGLDERSIYHKRSSVRAEGSLAVDVFDLNGNRLAEGTALNLGVGGVLLHSLADLDRDSQVVLQVGPYQRLPAMECRGLILHRGAEPDRKSWNYSIRFLEPDAEQVKLLGKYVILLLKESSGLFGR